MPRPRASHSAPGAQAPRGPGQPAGLGLRTERLAPALLCVRPPALREDAAQAGALGPATGEQDVYSPMTGVGWVGIGTLF